MIYLVILLLTTIFYYYYLGEFSIGSTLSPLSYILFILITFVLDIVLIF